jgi:autotransporter adhesin
MAFGAGATAIGVNSIALGFNLTAIGPCSVALGGNSTASGNNSTAFGHCTTASAENSFVVGAYNVGGAGPTVSGTDPVFEIGNGYYNSATSTAVPSDALVVYRNGSATFQGPVTVAPGGDIPMFSGY